jgi:hypothetical protein
MIKDGLKPNSQSNGRELEYTILSLQNSNIEDEFSQLIKQILHNKQIAPNKHNGLRKFNTLFQTYIKKVYKEYKTVNVYARGLNSENFLPFWGKLKLLIKANPNIFQGRLEPHPADREINSWHIQYTGANATYIEQILAAFVVKEKMESSMQMALGTDIKPHYQTHNILDEIQDINDELLVQKLIKKSKQIPIIEDIKTVESLIEKITFDKEIIKKSVISLKDKLKKIKQNINITNKDKVFEDIKNRKSQKAQDIINKIKKDKNI